MAAAAADVFAAEVLTETPEVVMKLATAVVAAATLFVTCTLAVEGLELLVSVLRLTAAMDVSYLS